MKQKRLLIFLVVILVVITLFDLYLIQKVPSCIQFEKQGTVNDTGSALYNNSEVAKLKTNLEISDYLVFWAQGESMEPTIKDNSKCICLKKTRYKKGDIIIFFMDTSEGWQGIGHQIISIEGDEVITKGINNQFLDIPLKQENILCYIPKMWRYQLIQKELTL